MNKGLFFEGSSVRWRKLRNKHEDFHKKKQRLYYIVEFSYYKQSNKNRDKQEALYVPCHDPKAVKAMYVILRMFEAGQLS